MVAKSSTTRTVIFEKSICIEVYLLFALFDTFNQI
jgi:hypothetical protein